MLKSYNNYVNEAIDMTGSGPSLGGVLLNFIKGAFKMVSDDVKDDVKKFSKSIGEKGTMKEALPEFQEKFQRMNRKMKKFFEEIEGEPIRQLPKIKEEVQENFVEVYMLLDAFANRFEIDAFKPINFFENPVFKKIYKYDNPKKFMANIEENVVSLLKEYGKKAGLEDEQLENLEKKVEEIEKETEENQEVKEAVEEDNKVEISKNLEKFKKLINKFIKNDFLDPVSKKLEDLIDKNEEKEKLNIYAEKISKIIPNEATDNEGTKKKIIKELTKIDDKDTLLQIREILGINKKEALL